MSQQLVTILQNLNAAENREPKPENLHTLGIHTNHYLIPNLSGTMKLEFPRFFGEEPTSWIYKTNQYFTHYNIPDNKKLIMASFHMDGEALVCFQEKCPISLLTMNYRTYLDSKGFKLCKS